MGTFFDNIQLTAQASSSAAGRLDNTPTTTQGGAGARGPTQNFVIGRGNTQTPTTSIAQDQPMPVWIWLVAAAVAALFILKWKG